jgi:hypothetical protein
MRSHYVARRDRECAVQPHRIAFEPGRDHLRRRDIQRYGAAFGADQVDAGQAFVVVADSDQGPQRG